MTLSIDKFKDRHRGETAWIVASGPSVKSHDLSQLTNKLTFAINGAAKLAKHFDGGFQYFMTSDNRFLSDPDNLDLCGSSLSQNTIRVLRDICRPFDDQRQQYRTTYVRTISRNGFSTNLRNGYHFGSTSVMLAIQFAYWTGCSNVVLLGADLSYAFENKRFYEEKIPQPVDKMLNVQLWNIANAARVFKSNNRKLFSCSERSLTRPYIDYIPFKTAIKKLL